jgi:hypothetical protein
VSTPEQLSWEARLSRPVAIAAFAAAALGLAGFVLRGLIIEDRPGILALPDDLLSTNASPGTFIASAAIGAVATLLLILVFLYLFRATIHRTAAVPRWFIYFIFAGPALYAIALIIGAFDQVDVAETFAEQSYSLENADSSDGPNLSECPAIRGDLGDACAEELVRENREDPNPVALVAGLAGPIVVAFLFVMLPLRARRAGLLSPFMGILGLLCGILIVLPLLPPVILQAFWLGALGALVLGRWPGGRGPAWETGEPDPWPSPARRRGLAGRGDSEAADEADIEPASPVDTEPPPERPSSRKRKRR